MVTLNNAFRNNSKTSFTRPDNQSMAAVEDYDIKKDIQTREGTIERTPTKPNDIVNKAYVDSQVSGENNWDVSGSNLIPHVSGSNIITTGNISGAYLYGNGSNITNIPNPFNQSLNTSNDVTFKSVVVTENVNAQIANLTGSAGNQTGVKINSYDTAITQMNAGKVRMTQVSGGEALLSFNLTENLVIDDASVSPWVLVMGYNYPGSSNTYNYFAIQTQPAGQSWAGGNVYNPIWIDNFGRILLNGDELSFPPTNDGVSTVQINKGSTDTYAATIVGDTVITGNIDFSTCSVAAVPGIDAIVQITADPVLFQTVNGSATFTKGILTAYTAPS